MVERWNTGILGPYCNTFKNTIINEINPSWIERISTEVLKAHGLGRCQLHGIDYQNLNPNTWAMNF
jgi:hypothetical protein